MSNDYYSLGKVHYTPYGTIFDGPIAELQKVEEIVCQQSKNSVLVLTDVRNTAISSEILDVFKESAVRTKPHVRKVAVVGVTGFKKALAQAVTWFSGLEMTLFDDVEQAKDWLVDM